MADAGRRDQVQHAAHHAETGTQDRHEADLVVGKHLRAAGRDGRLDFDFLQREIAGDLIRHQHGDLFEQLAEILVGRFFHPHPGQLVLDQRMIDDVDVQVFGHGLSLLDSYYS